MNESYAIFNFCLQVEIEQGKILHFKVLAIGDVTDRGDREVFFEMNGQFRSTYIRDAKAKKSADIRPKIQKGTREHVDSPMMGTILEVPVKESDTVQKGQPVAVLSAMKMEMVVQAPFNGKISRVHITPNAKVEADDLLVEMSAS